MRVSLLNRVRGFCASLSVGSEARAAAAADRHVLGPDPGPDAIIDAGVAWLAQAQDKSASADGGVARHYSLVSGWAPSYPETTGYIVPTLLAVADHAGRSDLMQRARRMLDWLISIQFPEGGFQGGVVGQTMRVPVVFNTGQILIGLSAGERSFGAYAGPLRRASKWLVTVQDADGCWRSHASPFALSGEKAYDAHVAWGLLEAATVIPGEGCAEAAIANLHWVLKQQRENGWFEKCCLDDPRAPLTHTLGYTLRGLIEGYRHTHIDAFLMAARRTADGLMSALGSDGRLPGRLRSDWSSASDWICLTGSSQIAHCWLQLYAITGEPRYRRAATLANRFVRRTVKLDGPVEYRGGVKGSFPVDGDYGTYEFLNWACKFTIDANLLERALDAPAAGSLVASA